MLGAGAPSTRGILCGATCPLRSRIDAGGDRVPAEGMERAARNSVWRDVVVLETGRAHRGCESDARRRDGKQRKSRCDHRALPPRRECQRSAWRLWGRLVAQAGLVGPGDGTAFSLGWQAV